MPGATFRTWVGLAKGNPSTYLTAATAAAATSVPVFGTVVPASSTIYIIDGANSEVRAVTAGGASSSLTVSALTNPHPIGTPVFWQLTASIGPADYMPVTVYPDAFDNITTVSDVGIRGSNVGAYGVFNVAGDSEINLGGDVIADTFGYLLGSIFGAVDFGAGTPNTHTFATMNTPVSNGQPTELMIWVYQPASNNTRLFCGVKASDLTITVDPMQIFKYTAKLKGFLTAVVATPTVSFSALGPQPAWQTTTTVAGTFIPNLMTASLTFTRTVDSIQTADGNQSPYKLWSGPITVTGTLDTVMEDDSLLNQYLNNSQPAVVLTLVNGTGATQVGVTIQMTKCNFLTGWKSTGGSPWVRAGGPIAAVANLTDSNTSGTGYSPARVVLRNSVVTGRYQ